MDGIEPEGKRRRLVPHSGPLSHLHRMEQPLEPPCNVSPPLLGPQQYHVDAGYSGQMNAAAHPHPMMAPAPEPGLGGGYARSPRIKKHVRAVQACDACRNRRSRCDEGKPHCSYCRENKQACVYREVQPPKADHIAKETVNLMRELKEQNNQLLSLFSEHVRCNGEGSYATNFLGGTAGVGQHSRDIQPTRQICNLGESQSPSRTASFDATDRRAAGPVAEIVPELAGDVGESLIPIKYTIAAKNPFCWPSIQELLRNPKYNEDYVMELEETRGLLCVYRQDKGLNLGDIDQPGLASPASSASGEEQAFSPLTPLEGPWNAGFSHFAGGNAKRLPHEDIGERNLNGTWKIDLETCLDLVKSYIDNIHILHPFLDKAWLTREVGLFAKSHDLTQNCHISTSFVPSDGFRSNNAHHTPTAPPNQAMKREHSMSTTSGPPMESSSGSSASFCMLFQPLLKPSITTAVVLLVMALGKICKWKNPLPGAVPDRMQLHRQQAQQLYSSVEKRLNIADVIPGMAYYTHATHILGSTHGGVELIHVQAKLLAGLYAGQLAHVIESWGWIAEACRACQVLVRPGKLDKTASAAYTDSVKVTFWTCVELESDILAEIDLPPSAITHYEQLDSQNLLMGDTLGDLTSQQWIEVMTYYSAQVQLGRTHNRIHSLYQSNSNHAGLGIELATELEEWRKVLPSKHQWSDDDWPSSDIKAARMRAKYYRARYLIHLPFLHHALHRILYRSVDMDRLSQPLTAQSGKQLQQDRLIESQARGHTDPPVSVKLEEVDLKIMRAAEICVKAAIKSSVAFDGICKRPILTNIFGTAHAQSGNMLVLVATYCAGLTPLISREELSKLLNQTIQLLNSLQDLSPTLAKDAEILRSVQKSHFPGNIDESFPSAGN